MILYNQKARSVDFRQEREEQRRENGEAGQ